MAAVTDYTSLTENVISYFEMTGDTAFAARIPTFIGLAEAGFNRNIRNRRMETSTTLSTDADGLVALPNDFLQARSITIDTSYITNLNVIGGDASGILFPFPNVGGDPYTVTIKGSNLIIYPNAERDVTLDYYAKFVGLSDTNPTNWVISQHPDLYQFATMAQACVYLRDDDGARLFGGQALGIADQINFMFGIDMYANAGITLEGDTP